MYKVKVRAINCISSESPIICASYTEVEGIAKIVFHNDRAYLRQFRTFLKRLCRTGYSLIDNGLIYLEIWHISDLGDGQD